MHSLKIWIVLISVWIVLGSTYPIIKIAVETIPPMIMIGVKSTFGGIFLMLIYKISFVKNKVKKKINKKNMPITRNNWIGAAIIGLLFVIGGPDLIAWAEQYLSSDLTVLIYSTVPIWTILLGNLFYKTSINNFTIIGIMVGTAGLVFLIFPSLESLFSLTNDHHLSIPFHICS